MNLRLSRTIHILYNANVSKKRRIHILTDIAMFYPHQCFYARISENRQH